MPLQVSPFQALLLVLTFRPDRLEAAMNGFVCAALNVKGVVPLPFSLKVETMLFEVAFVLNWLTKGRNACQMRHGC
eukprot:scaffold49639_cov19-Tisochrysis_lutea.AAC.1